MKLKSSRARYRLLKTLSKELRVLFVVFEAWYNDRYGKKLVLSSINKTNASDLLKHFFLEIRDTRKDSLGEEYEPSTLSTYRNGLRRYFLERKDGESFDIWRGRRFEEEACCEKETTQG